MRKRRRLALALVLTVSVAVVLWRASAAKSVFAEVHILDVGQGDAIFIELPEGTQILVDGGPDASVLAELSAVMDPFDQTIDVVLATHPDADHIGGLPDVLARYDVRLVVDSGLVRETALYRAWTQAVAAEGAEVQYADSAKRLRFGDVAVLDMLWPQESLVGTVRKDANEFSIVTRFTYGSIDMLLTGDIERWAEYRLVASGVVGDVEVLKVPHHGSKTSTTSALLEATTPELAVISVGERNRYGHPDSGVLSRLAERAIPILRTDQAGRITLQTDGNNYWIVE